MPPRAQWRGLDPARKPCSEAPRPERPGDGAEVVDQVGLVGPGGGRAARPACPPDRSARQRDARRDGEQQGGRRPPHHRVRHADDDQGEDVRGDRDGDDDVTIAAPRAIRRSTAGSGHAALGDRPDDGRATDDRDGDDRERGDRVVWVLGEGQDGPDGVDLGRQPGEREGRGAGRTGRPCQSIEPIMAASYARPRSATESG